MKAIGNLSNLVITECPGCNGRYFYLNQEGQVCYQCGRIHYLSGPALANLESLVMERKAKHGLYRFEGEE